LILSYIYDSRTLDIIIIVPDRLLAGAPLLALPLLDFCFSKLPQLVDLRWLARGYALRQFHKASKRGAVGNGVRSGAGLHANDTDARVLWTSIMLAVAEVTDPCLERRRVVFLDNATVCLDGSMARYGSPFSRVVDETDVDRRVCLKIVCLARFGVGVEEKIEAVALLFGVSIVQFSENKRHSPDINTPVLCVCVELCHHASNIPLQPGP
jgi:hypothetical protein